MLFWNLFLQSAAIILVVMLIGKGISAWIRSRAKD